jgi:DNA-binding IclR family transcriptional regulator
MPLAATGVGKALLLDAEEPQWKALHRIGEPVSSRAPGGRQTWEAFRDRMREYAAKGYAFDLEDNEPSIRCVAAPVRDASSGIVAAISVSSTVPYMSLERMREMVAVVQGTAAGISAELGWKVERA